MADAVPERARVHEQRRRANVAVQDPHALERQPQRRPPAILCFVTRTSSSIDQHAMIEAEAGIVRVQIFIRRSS